VFALGARTFIHSGRRGRSATGSDDFISVSVRAVVPEAPLRMTKYGLAPDGEGWFVVNAREARWRDWGPLGSYCDFEGKRRFPQLGINISVLEPGQSLGRYHRENGQEGFLVLAGTCLLIVEDEERELRTWDFFHCPPQTEHMIVGAGDGRAVVLAVGARGFGRKGLVYPVSTVARRHGVSVEKETAKPAEAYADLARPTRVTYHDGWLPDR
jgi:quercetin dioxygenase-like cupin family protein